VRCATSFLILITYLFYAMDWLPGNFDEYHILITGLGFGMITGPRFVWVFTVLAGLLLFWVFALTKELSDKGARSSAAT
jgi:hypothetical protein